MNPIVLEMLGVALRFALTSLSGYLVTKHIVTADQGDRFTDAIVAHALLWAPGATALAWAVVAKYRGRIKFLTALESRPGTSESEVKQIIKQGMGATL